MSFMNEVVRMIDDGKTIKEASEAVGKTSYTIEDGLYKLGYKRINQRFVRVNEDGTPIQPAVNKTKIEKPIQSQFTKTEITTLKEIASQDLGDKELSDILLTIHKLGTTKKQANTSIPLDIVEELKATSQRLGIAQNDLLAVALLDFFKRVDSI